MKKNKLGSVIIDAFLAMVIVISSVSLIHMFYQHRLKKISYLKEVTQDIDREYINILANRRVCTYKWEEVTDIDEDQ
ncbi:MAG: hypothetical protein ACK5KQ_06750 [Anaerorhabdus sp.]